MLAGKAAASDAVWHSNRNGKASKTSLLGVTAKPAARPVLPKGTAKVPEFIAPQLCKRVDRPPVRDYWVHEIKLDGYRMQLRIADGTAVNADPQGSRLDRGLCRHRASSERTRPVSDRYVEEAADGTYFLDFLRK